MLAATALQLDIFSHVHWQMDDMITGLQLATPCMALEAGLLLLHSTLYLSNDTQPRSAAPTAVSPADSGAQHRQAPSDQATASAALLSAIDAVYLHNIRYSLIGAASTGSRVALEAGAQVSEELLARGVLLGYASTWITSR